MLPVVLGPNAVGKSSLPSYTMVSRRSYGSFHDDLQRVCECLRLTHFHLGVTCFCCCHHLFSLLENKMFSMPKFSIALW